MILVKSLLIFSLGVGFNSQSFAASMADLAPMLTTFAQAGQQYQQQSKQFEQQKKEQQSKLNEINVATSQQTAMADMTSPYGTGATPPVAAAGYPLTDPYANPQYWTQRGQQFKFSMDVAAKRSDAMNSMAKIQLEQEKQKQKMMMEGVGTVMQSAGGLMEQMAADKKAEELKIASELEVEQQAAEGVAKDRKKLVKARDRLQSQLDDIDGKIAELEGKGTLTESEQKKLDRLYNRRDKKKDELLNASYSLEDFNDENPIIDFSEEDEDDNNNEGQEGDGDGAGGNEGEDGGESSDSNGGSSSSGSSGTTSSTPTGSDTGDAGSEPADNKEQQNTGDAFEGK